MSCLACGKWKWGHLCIFSVFKKTCVLILEEKLYDTPNSQFEVESANMYANRTGN